MVDRRPVAVLQSVDTLTALSIHLELRNRYEQPRTRSRSFLAVRPEEEVVQLV
jgi:hypothetical protein